MFGACLWWSVGHYGWCWWLRCVEGMWNGSRQPSDTTLTSYSQPLFTAGKSIRVNIGSYGAGKEVAREKADADEEEEEEEEKSQAALGKDWTEYVAGNGRPYYHNSVNN